VGKFRDRLAHAWNAFVDSDSANNRLTPTGGGAYSFGRQDRPRMRFANERTIITSIITRIAIDVAGIPIRHVRVDADGRYLEDINSGLDQCLTVQANIDQPGRAFRQDIIQTLLDEGTCAIVPVDTTLSPESSGGYDIKTLRVGRITDWRPQHVRVSVYDENRGIREELTLHKSVVAIIENPLYSVMNEPNSTLQRLLDKLRLLDDMDHQAASNKLDLIIQLPYVVKTEQKRQQAEQRMRDIEFQLSSNKYGVAYADGTEKVIQLNRAIENNLLPQIKELKDQLYGELGITESVMNGTADENAWNNYRARTLEPLLDATIESMICAFLTKTARTQGQSLMYFRDPFKFLPLGGEGGIAKIADAFARNEITSSNEIRQGIGMKPRPEAKADALQNSNMPQPNGEVVDGEAVDITDDQPELEPPDPEADAMIDDLAASEAEIDAALAGG
jgi:Phage portal protein